MILTRYGPGKDLALLGEVERGVHRLEPFSVEDVAEAMKLIEHYAGFGDIGLADASNVVLAERYGTSATFACSRTRQPPVLPAPGGLVNPGEAARASS